MSFPFHGCVISYVAMTDRTGSPATSAPSGETAQVSDHRFPWIRSLCRTWRYGSACLRGGAPGNGLAMRLGGARSPLDGISRLGMGRASTRRSNALRVPHSRRRSSGPVLAHDPEETGGLSEG